MKNYYDQAVVAEMNKSGLTPDCYVSDEQYPHHLYLNGEKLLVEWALYSAIAEAKARGDSAALSHLLMHEKQLKG
jgi:hypothetical protein